MPGETQVVLSGLRATGRLHVGNYFGVLRRFAKMSQDPTLTCLFFVADLHTLTTPAAGQQIAADSWNIILDFLAAGVDPDRSLFYYQSDVHEIPMLSWALSCLTPEADLRVMPSFKDKADKMRDKGELVNAGLFTYPVLMAADILGPRANLVPVGQDQMAHLYLAQHLARRFNRQFVPGFFPEPDALEQEAITVPGLKATQQGDLWVAGKMGKSDGNTINLSDSPDVVRKKLKKAMHTGGRLRLDSPGRPWDCNIHDLHCCLAGTDDEQATQVRSRCQAGDTTFGCGHCKMALADRLNTQLLIPFQESRKRWEEDPAAVQEMVRRGTAHARALFAETTSTVLEAMGIQPRPWL